MKKNKLFAVLFGAVACATVSFATTQEAVNLAADQKASTDRVCVAVADAVKEGVDAPSQIFTRVLSARQTWTVAQLTGVYKSILLASDKLSASFGEDYAAFEDAGKPTSVADNAPEGVKLLAALYAVNVAGVNADAIVASVMADTMGASMLRTVSPLRDTSAGVATRRKQPAKPTPPAVSFEN